MLWHPYHAGLGLSLGVTVAHIHMFGRWALSLSHSCRVDSRRAVMLLIPFATGAFASAASALDPVASALKNGGAYVESSAGTALYQYRADDRFIPASTAKLATAGAALHDLGARFRFRTEFFLTSRHCLVIRGGGDPSMTSRELRRIASALAERVSQVACLWLDDRRFELPERVDGQGATTNPFDAPVSAFPVNFNTVTIQKRGAAQIRSGEEETPLVPFARELARGLPNGSHRINLGGSQQASRYALQLLAALLRERGVQVADVVRPEFVQDSAAPLYVHESSETLEQVVSQMLRYSTNLTANQIFLVLGAHQFGYPATIAKGQRAVQQFLRRVVGWREGQIMEGSGLSRETKATPREMVTLLKWFEKHRELLPIDSGFQAKTGTLTGVNALAGYFTRGDGTRARFALLINAPTSARYKFQVAEMLRRVVG